MKAPLPPNFEAPFWATKNFRFFVLMGAMGVAVMAVIVFDIGPKLTQVRNAKDHAKKADPNAFVPPPAGAGGDVKFEGVLQKVKDGTSIDDQEEAYQYLIRYLSRADASQIAQDSKNVEYPTYAKMPVEMRGYTTKISALFLQSNPIRVDAAPGGVNFIHRTYLSDLSGKEGYVVDLLEPPGELPMRTVVALDAIFFKLGTYEGKNGDVQAPLFLGKSLRTVKERMASGPTAALSGGTMLGIAIGALVVMMVLTSLMFRKSKPPAPKSPAAMETLKA
ncbi:MAG: hypothetical protein EHM91_03075 [Planctomycetota bacterium]|nr:MAG: hypothetical protein EHM91_03075 [Planctomycetota bacterium]